VPLKWQLLAFARHQHQVHAPRLQIIDAFR
jgi:hypothetical protein